MSERDWPWADERLDEMATPSQIERANEAALANLRDDGTPKWDSAQGYACALTAVMLCDARAAETQTGRVRNALEAFVRHHRRGGRPYTRDLLSEAECALGFASGMEARQDGNEVPSSDDSPTEGDAQALATPPSSGTQS